MEAILSKITWAVLALAGGFIIWAVKGLVKVVFENRDRIKDGYFKNAEQDKALIKIVQEIDKHENRLDGHDVALTKIVATHNTSSCGRQNKIEIKV